RRSQCWQAGGQRPIRSVSRPFPPSNLNILPNLRQCLDKASRLIGRDVPAVPAQHVQAIRPISPTRLVGCNLISQRSLMSTEQGK
ncbi:unnamed protein product, partial [Mycena citricolor]